MKRLLLATMALFALVSCKVINIENGEVPDQYLSQAKQLEGVYRGFFEGVDGQMVISFEGNKPYVRLTDLKGRDLVLPHCGAAVGKLKWVYFTRHDEARSVAFYFNPGACFVEGREFVMNFSNYMKRIDVTVLDRRTTERRCRWEVSDPQRGPQEICEFETREKYLEGRFSR